MLSPLAKILQSDLDILATLANAKLAPAPPYAFAPFAGDDQIQLPADLAPAATYGAGFFADSSKVTLRLYGYKTISGKKTFTSYFTRKAFVGAAGSGNFSLTWTWANPIGDLAPDGYIAVIPQPLGGGPAIGWEYFWQDIGLVETLSSNGSFDASWKIDSTLDAANEGHPEQNLPCGHGAWLKVLNQIHNDLFGNLDLFGGSAFAFDDTWLVSGPWCVSVAPKCCLYLGAPAARQPVYKNLRFIYSEADSPTGNQLAPEADMPATYIGVKNGANHFDWDANVVINGTITIYSPGQNQAAGDWTLAASHPGIDISINETDIDTGVIPNQLCTSFTFKFTDVQYTTGTPVILTVTPLSGGSVVNPGNANGAGGLANCVFTGDKVEYAAVDTIAIHPGSATVAPAAAKSAAIPNTLTALIITLPNANTSTLETHHRCFCAGVFTANTLPTLGVMPYLDVDLPQYNPSPLSAQLASSRRIPRNDALTYLPVTENRAALWPVFRDTDFAPDDFHGKPITGSIAWQRGLATKFAIPAANTDTIAPTQLFRHALFIPDGSADVRFYADDPNVIIYIKANAFPTIADFDAQTPGAVWFSLAAALPGFETNTTWFYGIYNPTDGSLIVTTNVILIESAAAPNGTFFPTIKDDSGNNVPQNEGYSYHFPGVEGLTQTNPVPTSGYCLSSITVRRQPLANPSGIAITPAAGTADLPVKIGLMKDFSFDTAGVFTELQTVTIPAGQGSVTVAVFIPVIAGLPLAWQADEMVAVMIAANFQPMMHSSFSPATAQVNAMDYVIGYYNGAPWYDAVRALLFFQQGFLALPILLPLNAAIYNDLTAALNLL